MTKIFKYLPFMLTLVLNSGTKAVPDSPGSIWGKLVLDDTWERTIYMSYIKSFEKKYTVSDDIIIASSKVDSSGKFTIALDNLPLGWSLLRLHVVKRGVYPASLIIGSSDENFYFIIANRFSNIELHNTQEKPVFKNVFISGAPYMKTVEYITNLSDFPNSINYKTSLIEKEFIEEVISEKLKLIADTCNNLLVSLYALYQTDFYSDYQKNPAYYKTYLLKWRKDNSPYFKLFQRQFPVSEKPVMQYILIGLFAGVIVFISMFIKDRSGRKIRKLSVQERKIFELLQKGASNQEISNEFNIELSTVKTHVSNIFSKMNFKSRAEAMNSKTK